MRVLPKPQAVVMVRGRPIVLDPAQLTFIDTNAIHWFVGGDAIGHPDLLRNASRTVRHVLDISATVGMDGDAWMIQSD